MRNKLKTILVLGTVLSLSIGPVLAQGRGSGGGGGMGASVGGGMGHAMGSASIGGQSGMNGRFGGQSDANISAQGRVNTNGPVAADRDFGSARASDRMDTTTRTNGNSSSRSELGGLNADHASDTARAHAASGSRVGEIGTYEAQMKSALAISDPVARNAAITRARQDLAQTTNKPLTSRSIAQLDSDLHIQGAAPQLGAAQ